MVTDFFNKVKSDEAEIKEVLKNAELEFAFENDQGLKAAIEKVSFFMKKLFKTTSKIRQLKLTFTVTDERLISLIDSSPEDFSPTLKSIQELYERNKLYLSNLGFEFDDLQKEDFSQATEALNKKIVHFSGEYLKFMKPPTQSDLETFFVNSYLYRNDRFNEVLNYTASILNMMLNKLTLYRTAVFLRFFQDKLLPQLEADTLKITERTNNLFQSTSTPADYEELAQMKFHNNSIITYSKAMLASRKPDERFYANTSIQVNMPLMMKRLKEIETEMIRVEKEFGCAHEYINVYPNYVFAASELRKVAPSLKAKKITKDVLGNAEIKIMGYNTERLALENFVRDLRHSNTKVYQDLNAILTQDVEEYNAVKKALFRAPPC